ncbi:hypothetical protein SIL77_01980 [Exiguobacterium profundum]|uniref:hypothetical protein n=1 Tax=Exiguobacterium TaxID=33986 RepID=UPI001BADD139|nr:MULTISPECIES: hypothetical protein [Exiguobacterium]MDX5980035.1 hypothetical protein [Exiguobacterium profundum]QUP88017.1 hypothetical protein KD909_04610 [Exiguobacterium sp. PFWT01]
MTNIEIVLELSKILSPIITVGLAAFLTARYYLKNKQVDYSMKLSEKAIEEVYNPIIVKIEKEAVNDGFSYEGLSADDLVAIDEIFSKNRHLVEESLLNILWKYQEDVHFEFSTLYGNEESQITSKDKFLDSNHEFLNEIKRVRNFHLKRIGFYFK